MLSTLRKYARGPVLTAPGPRSGDMLRAIGAIQRDPVGFLEHMAAQHGPVVQFPVPVPPSYFFADADSVRHVLVDNARAYDKQTMQYRGLATLTGDGLLTSDAGAWRAARKVVQPAFHHAAVAAMRTSIEQAADRVVASWNEPTIDLEAQMMRIALLAVGDTMFGADLSAEAEQLSSSTLSALDAVVRRAQRPWSAPLGVPTRANRSLNQALRALDMSVDSLVSQRLASQTHSPDLLGLLIQAHMGEQPWMSFASASGDSTPVESQQQRHRGQLQSATHRAFATPTAVRDEVVTFIVAGHETVASGLTWSWQLLLQHPEVLAEMCGIEDNEQRERYARAVFEEALRLYPPAWLITRRSLQSDTIAGITIPQGALVILSPWVTHRDQRWWPEPHTFNPHRFLEDSDARRLAYLPFGVGQRMCIGREMALLEGAVVLARMCRQVRLAARSPLDLRRHASVTLRPAEPVVVDVEHI